MSTALISLKSLHQVYHQLTQTGMMFRNLISISACLKKSGSYIFDKVIYIYIYTIAIYDEICISKKGLKCAIKLLVEMKIVSWHTAKHVSTKGNKSVVLLIDIRKW